MPHTKKNYNLIISANILPIVIEASQMAVNGKFVLRWHGTYCRMQIIGLCFVVKYTYAQGQVTKSEDMPRPDARGRGRGQHVEAEDKISAPRTVWPRGLNITACKLGGSRRPQSPTLNYLSEESDIASYWQSLIHHKR